MRQFLCKFELSKTKNFGLLEVWIKKGLNVHVLEFAFIRFHLSHTHTHTACNIVVICHDIKKKNINTPNCNSQPSDARSDSP